MNINQVNMLSLDNSSQMDRRGPARYSDIEPNSRESLTIDTSRSPMIAGVALDGTGWQVVHLFHHINISRFFHLPRESGKCNNSHTPITPRAPLSATGEQTEQHIQPIGTKKYKQG
jgi:hypothetical protein